jgi:hypothetical protein
MSGEELSRQIRNHGHHAIFIRHGRKAGS